EIEMGDHDVAHIGGAEPEPFDVAHGCFVRIVSGVKQVTHWAEPTRIGDISQPIAGVDEDKAAVGFDEKHMVNHRRRPRRSHGSAVEVVNLHGARVCRTNSTVAARNCSMESMGATKPTRV